MMSTLQELFTLDGKVALVTGGNSGIGRAIARGLRSAGASIAVTGRNGAKNEAMAKELDDGLVLELDVRDESAVEQAITAVEERFGRLDILVNNAGQSLPGSIVDLSTDAWQAIIDTHLGGSFYASRAAARRMIAQGDGGKILNIGSMYSLFGSPRLVNYSAAKTGMLGMTRSLAVDLARYGIQVNALLPGWFETDMTRGLPSTPVGEKIRRHTPAGRWGEDADLVGTALFLSSRASDFVTGVIIPVDGGYAASDGIMSEDWTSLLP